MNILIKTLTMINFKGVKNFTVDFNFITNIYGANASGKTTIFDAFTWLLFGKDSTDRKDFNVKPLDPSGTTRDRTENEVSAVLEVDGQDITIRHIQKEKWTKKRGEEVAEFTGNEHLYFWNDVPVNAGEFQAKVNDLLPENVFKLITNPLYFNSQKWQDQRSVLSELAGEITDSFLTGKYPELQELLNALDGKTLKEFKAKVSSDKKNLKDQLAEIPGRIDEAERGKPEPVNEAEVNARIAELQAEYDGLEQAIVDKNAANEKENSRIQAVQKDIHDLKLEIQNIEAAHRSAYTSDVNAANSGVNEDKAKLNNLDSQLRLQENQLKQLEQSHADQLARIEHDKQDINDRLVSLRTLFISVNGRELNPNDKVCKECGREHEAHNIAELQTKFNEIKRKELEGLNIQGAGLKKDLEKRKSDIVQAKEQFEITKSAIITSLKNLKASLEEVQTKVELAKNKTVVVKTYEDRVMEDDAIVTKMNKITELQEQLETTPVDYGDLRIKKATVNADLDTEKRKLNTSETIAKADKRIQELKDQEKTMSQQLASLEKQEFAAEKYEKAKSEELENRVNGMFKFAKFKLFKPLINGGEEPTCQTTYNGVPFSDLNTAGKILVGIDIISTLSAHYGVIAPIWLDNRESITVIPDTASQVINLIVSSGDEKLRVA
ncbi:AAA family ATPase [Sphingobacterium psychroaquaticum]|uniref:p-loop containing region of AAA domain-containing protein n=1 Tax=Sphingobacterium psychroaquaticum TaxID=561061 RepID=A0A1X7JTQ3_9SPHI|nr:AAA family ATPase [Sphingobacterium psychroaquaticum]SMG31762.1 P-loop containing region of AAA domain-containing protein [Sphingobacterium psychroaquaticum]